MLKRKKTTTDYIEEVLAPQTKDDKKNLESIWENIEKEMEEKRLKKKREPENFRTEEITYEKLMEQPVTPLEDFDYITSTDSDGKSYVKIYEYIGDSEYLVMPEEFDGIPITKFPYFNRGLGKAKAIRLPEHIKEMNFKSVSVGDNIEIVVTEGLEKVNESAFSLSSKLREIHLNEGIKEIEKEAFNYCENLREITIPKTVEKVDDNTFLTSRDTLIKLHKGGSDKVKEAVEYHGLTWEEIE